MRVYHSDITKAIVLLPNKKFKLNIQLSYGICNVNFLIYKSSQSHHDICFSLKSEIRPTPPYSPKSKPHVCDHHSTLLSKLLGVSLESAVGGWVRQQVA